MSMPAPDSVKRLVDHFDQDRKACPERSRRVFPSADLKEEPFRAEFLNPFFESLGWDMDNALDTIWNRNWGSVPLSPRYKDPGFMSRLKTECERRHWPVKWSGEKIVVHESDVEVLLRLLNDDRLSSLLTDGIYDVSAKKPVS
jgi:hypothetical protein